MDSRGINMRFAWAGTDDELEALLAPLREAVNAQGLSDQEELTVVPPPTEADIKPQYASISAIKDITEPWIEAFSGDEWGDLMGSLHNAIHTDYGLSDEEVAVIATLVWNAVDHQYRWWVEEGKDYRELSDDDLAKIYDACRKARDYWSAGGNVGSFANHAEIGKATADSLPGWVYGE